MSLIKAPFRHSFLTLAIIALLTGCAADTPPTPAVAALPTAAVTETAMPTAVPPTIAPPSSPATMPTATPTAVPAITPPIAPPTPTVADTATPSPTAIPLPPLPAPTDTPPPNPADFAAKPPALTAVAQIGQPMTKFAEYGDFVYAAAGMNLLVIDFSDPTAPRQVNALAVPGIRILSLTVDGSVLLVSTIPYSTVDAAPVSALFYDVTTPGLPRFAGDFTSLYWNENAIISSGQYFTAGGGIYNPFALRAVDFSDPANAQETLLYEFPEITWPNLPRSVAFARQGDVIIIFLDDERRAIDISNFDAPVETAVTEDMPQTPPAAEPGRYQLLPDAVQLLDRTDPANPVVIGQFDRPTFAAYDIAVIDGFAYVVSEEGALRIVDVSDPAAPQLAALAAAEPALANVERVFAVGPYLGTLERPKNGVGRLQFWDTAAVPGLTRISATPVTLETGIRAVAVGNGRLYILTGTGLHITDIANLRTPQEIGSWAVPNGEAVTVSGDIVYLAGANGLTLLDVSTPSAIQEIGALSLFAPPESSGGVQGCALVKSAPDQLHLTNISLIGQTVYVASSNGCLTAIDVANSAQPELVGSALFGALAVYRDMFVWHNFLVGVIDEQVMETERRLTYFNQTPPDSGFWQPAASLELIGEYAHSPRGVVYGDYVFVTNGRSGAFIIRAAND